MSSEEILEAVRQDIMNTLPPNAEITSIDFEGPEIAIYCKNEEFIGDESEDIKNLVKRMRKRIVIRSDPSIRRNSDETVDLIKSIVPEDAEITKVFFNENLGEVIIEARKPGVAIGKVGQNLKDIKRQTLWLPRVIRTPPIESKTVELVRNMLQKERQAQKEILIRIGNRIHRSAVLGDLHIKITGLGAFREVGRSAVFVQTNESNVLLDCGTNIGNPDDNFPFLDIKDFDIRTLDAVVLTHSHIDHCGAVPYLYKYGFDGPVYTTEPSMHLSTMMQLDYINVCEREGRISPYSKKDIKTTVLHTYCLDWGKVHRYFPRH